MVSTHRWDRWRTWCGWLAIASAMAWAAKFLVWTILAAGYTGGRVDDHPSGPAPLVLLVGFVLPTAGSVMGLIAGSGLAVPLVRTRPWNVGIPLAVLSAALVTVALSTLVNASTSLFADADSLLWRVEGTDLVGSVLLLALGLLLLRGPGQPSTSVDGVDMPDNAVDQPSR